MYRSHCIAVSGEKEAKVKLAVTDSCLVECGNVSSGKSDFPQGSIAYICGIKHRKNNGVFFKEMGKFCLLYQILTTYFQIP